MTHLIQPIINLNGQSREEHVRLRADAIEALQKAFAALAQLRPHGRDYCGDHERYRADLKEHTRRLTAINDLEDALVAEGLSIDQEP